MIKVLVFPRTPTDPYQDLLYGAMPDGIEVAYYPEPTQSQTLNLLLFPFILAIYRARGYRVFHLHWSALFAPVWAKSSGARRVMQAWYGACLDAARLLGYRIVWTAHNVMPLVHVFHDDLASRRRLVGAASVVIVHNAAAIRAVESLGAERIERIPSGPFGHYPDDMTQVGARRLLQIGPGERVAAFVGSITNYKGPDLFLEAASSLGPDLGLRLVIAGSCRDRQLRERLEIMARGIEPPVITRFQRIPDDELQVYLRAADVAVLPFRRITNSSSLLLAFNFGLPVVIPAFPELEDVPDGAAIRYDPEEEEGLGHALRTVAALSQAQLVEMSEQARAYVAGLSWEDTARRTVAAYELALGEPSARPNSAMPASRPAK